MVGPRMLFQQIREGVERDVDTPIPVDVDVDVEARLPERLDPGLQLLWWREPLAVMAIDVTGLSHLHVLREHRAVREILDTLRVDDPPGILRLSVFKLFGRRGSRTAAVPTLASHDEGPKWDSLGIVRFPQGGAWPWRTACGRDRGHTAAMDQVSHEGQAVAPFVGIPQVGFDTRCGHPPAALPEASALPVDALGHHRHVLLRDVRALERGRVQHHLVRRALRHHDGARRRNRVQILPSDGPVPEGVPAPREEGLFGIRIPIDQLLEPCQVAYPVGHAFHKPRGQLPVLGGDDLVPRQQRGAQPRMQVRIDQPWE